MYIFYSKLPKNIMSSEITQNDKSPDQFSEVNGQKRWNDQILQTWENLKEKIDKVEVIIADIQSIMDIENVDIQKKAIVTFIQKRLWELEQESTEKIERLSLLTNTAEGKFINPETEIKRSWLVDSFKINDPDIYQILLENFSKFYKHWNKPSLRAIITHSIIYALSEYFGNHFSTQDTDTQSREFYLDHSSGDSTAINLTELKGKNLAVCAEKATVAHNYLKFVGIDSYVIFSDRCKLGDSTNAHAYIIFATKNGRFIFDPSNPILVEDSESKIKSVNPALYQISEEDYNHLLNRDHHQVEVQHIDQKLDNGKYISQAPQIRIYA